MKMLLHKNGMVEMDFFTKPHYYRMQIQRKIKKTKLQYVEIMNSVLFIKT